MNQLESDSQMLKYYSCVRSCPRARPPPPKLFGGHGLSRWHGLRCTAEARVQRGALPGHTGYCLVKAAILSHSMLERWRPVPSRWSTMCPIRASCSYPRAEHCAFIWTTMAWLSALPCGLWHQHWRMAFGVVLAFWPSASRPHHHV